MRFKNEWLGCWTYCKLGISWAYFGGIIFYWSGARCEQNAALRTATGCTQDTNIQHLHDETLTLPIHEHLQLHASQYKKKTQHPSHPLHKHTTYFNTPRLKTHYF